LRIDAKNLHHRVSARDWALHDGVFSIRKWMLHNFKNTKGKRYRVKWKQIVIDIGTKKNRFRVYENGQESIFNSETVDIMS